MSQQNLFSVFSFAHISRMEPPFRRSCCYKAFNDGTHKRPEKDLIFYVNIQSTWEISLIEANKKKTRFAETFSSIGKKHQPQSRKGALPQTTYGFVWIFYTALVKCEPQVHLSFSLLHVCDSIAAGNPASVFLLSRWFQNKASRVPNFSLLILCFYSKSTNYT